MDRRTKEHVARVINGRNRSFLATDQLDAAQVRMALAASLEDCVSRKRFRAEHDFLMMHCRANRARTGHVLP